MITGMTGLGVLAFGGATHSGASVTDPVVEIWECMLAVQTNPDFAWNQGQCDDLAAILNTWFESADARISNTEFLDYVKWNEYNLATGHQVTDPTFVTNQTNVNGAVSSIHPVTTSYRISLDDSTRNQRHKGGFFPPRSGMTIQADGRFDDTQLGNCFSAAETLITGINTYLAGLAHTGHVAVWSRAGHSTSIVSRLRIGDVPDNVSRRKNHLKENYRSVDI